MLLSFWTTLQASVAILSKYHNTKTKNKNTSVSASEANVELSLNISVHSYKHDRSGQSYPLVTIGTFKESLSVIAPDTVLHFQKIIHNIVVMQGCLIVADPKIVDTVTESFFSLTEKVAE